MYRVNQMVDPTRFIDQAEKRPVRNTTLQQAELPDRLGVMRRGGQAIDRIRRVGNDAPVAEDPADFGDEDGVGSLSVNRNYEVGHAGRITGDGRRGKARRA